MKRLLLILFVSTALLGCKDRVIWDDKGKVDEAATDREVWDSKGKIDTGDRKIWNKEDGEPVIK